MLLVWRVRGGEVVEVEGDTLGAPQGRQPFVHRLHLLGADVLVLGEVLGLADAGGLGEFRVQEVRVERDLHVRGVGELTECGSQVSDAQIAPRAGHVRPDVNVHDTPFGLGPL